MLHSRCSEVVKHSLKLPGEVTTPVEERGLSYLKRDLKRKLRRTTPQASLHADASATACLSHLKMTLVRYSRVKHVKAGQRCVASSTCG